MVLETVDAAPVPPPTVLATNQGDITRFPDETAIPNVRATFLRPASIRETPPGGTVVLGLPRGATVTEVAQRSTYFLILFDNPKQPGAPLLGWVSKDAFGVVGWDAGADEPTDAAADASAPGPDVVAALPGGKCPADFVLVTKTGKCHRPCTTSTSKTECRNNPYFCGKCDVEMKHVCLDGHNQCAAK